MSESPQIAARAGRSPVAWLVFGVAVLCWVSTLWNGYAMDDLSVARAFFDAGADGVAPRNAYISDVLPLGEYFSSHYWAATVENDTLFRPVTILSFAIREALVGDSAFVDHLINVLLHGLASVLVLRLCLLAGADERASTWAGLSFAVLAIHAEAVANVVGRAELFAFTFGAAATLLVGARGGLVRSILACVLFFLALCSKESAIAWLPFWFVIGFVRTVRGRAWGFKCALWTILPAFLLWFFLRQNMIAGLDGVPSPPPYASNPLASASTLVRGFGSVESMGLGLLLSLVPAWLACDWGAQLFEPSALPRLSTLVAGAALGAWLFYGIRRYRTAPLFFLGLAAFLGFAFPLSNALFPIGVSFAERLYYLPSLGIAFLVAWLVGSSERTHAVVAIAILCLANFAVAQWRGPLWKNDDTIHLTDVERQPTSVNLQLYAARARMARRTQADAQRALEHVRAALRLDGQSAVAWSALAAIQSGAGAWKEAAGSLEVGLRADHLAGHHAEDRLWLNLGNVRVMQKNSEAAIAAYARALQASRYRAEAFEGLLRLRREGALEPEAFDRILAQAASSDTSDKRREVWEAYRILAQIEGRQIEGRGTSSERRRLLAIRDSLPRGIYADPLRRVIEAVVKH